MLYQLRMSNKFTPGKTRLCAKYSRLFETLHPKYQSFATLLLVIPFALYTQMQQTEDALRKKSLVLFILATFWASQAL